MLLVFLKPLFTQSAFTCSKLTIEILEQGAKYMLLAQFFFTTSETEVDYYHQKVNVRFSSRVTEKLKA